MIEVAQGLPASLVTDPSVLWLFPSRWGMPYGETKTGVFRFAAKTTREILTEAVLHPTVLQRFREPAVLQADELKPYRPAGLTMHHAMSAFYGDAERKQDSSMA